MRCFPSDNAGGITMHYRWLLALAAGGALSISTPVCAETTWQPATTRSVWEGSGSAGLRWELSYLALSVIDTAQTINCLNRNMCEEANPIFGKHPSPGKLIAAKLAFGAAHFAMFNHLNKKNPRGALRFAQGSVLVQGGVVALNARFSF